MGTELPLNCPRCNRSLAAGARFCDRCGVPVQPNAVDPLSAPPLRVGELLEGKWRLEGKLGAGGMGAVFLARDVALGRKVAIKILAAALCDDHEFVTRFEREARATAALEHPNIVPIHAVGRHQGRPFIVMKALEGQTLSKALKSRVADGRRMGRDEVLPLFRQLCDGLGFIHEKGYVHRDVKSGNVFLGNDGHLTILDFGVLRDASAERITRSGVLVGTPTYASPEQVRGGEVDSRADLYAVGVLLFECIALAPPFAGDPITLMKQHSGAEPPDLAALAPSLPPGVPAMVKKSLAKKPEERFQTARELYQALEAAWPGSPPATRAPIAPEREETAPFRPGVDTTAKVPVRFARVGAADMDSAAETLPADAVSVAALLGARASPRPASPQPALPQPALPQPALPQAPEPVPDWQEKTELIHTGRKSREEMPTLRIRNIKKVEAAPGTTSTDDERPPTEKAPPPTEKVDPALLAASGEKPETTGELVLKIRPRRWPYALGALAVAAAAAAAWLQWGAR